jgi:hypothetical protein
VAGWPRLPALSVARTWNVCGPSASAVYSIGEPQATNAPASSAHSNSAGSSAAKTNVAAACLLGSAGPLTIVAVGPVLSMVQL